MADTAMSLTPQERHGLVAAVFMFKTLGGSGGLYSLAVGAVLGALLFAITALFKKANEVEAAHLDEVDAHYMPHDVAEAVRGPHPSHRRA